MHPFNLSQCLPQALNELESLLKTDVESSSGSVKWNEKEMQDGSAAAADPIEDSMTLEALIGKEEEKITRETESFSPPSPENAGADDCCSLRTNNLSLTRKHT